MQLGLVSASDRPLGRGLRLLLAGGAMLLFLLLALEFALKVRPLGLLGAVVVVVVVASNRLWLLDVGFQLSVAATAGRLVSASPLEQWLRDHLVKGSGRSPRRWTGPLAAALAVPIAATIWRLPLQLLHFGLVPGYAVPANLAAAPLLTPLTLASMALALVEWGARNPLRGSGLSTVWARPVAYRQNPGKQKLCWCKVVGLLNLLSWLQPTRKFALCYNVLCATWSPMALVCSLRSNRPAPRVLALAAPLTALAPHAPAALVCPFH